MKEFKIYALRVLTGLNIALIIYYLAYGVYFDPENNAWFVPEDMIKRHEIKKEEQ